MGRAADDVLKDALDLPVEARAALVDSLLDSLDPAFDPRARSMRDRSTCSLERIAIPTESADLVVIPRL